MTTQELLSRLGENVSVRRAFGAAYEKDGVLIIPVALVAGGGGGGGGTYPWPVTAPGAAPLEGAAPGGAAPSGAVAIADDSARLEAANPPTGSNSGGGFGGLIMPVGVYVVNGDQVRWVPAWDVTVIVLAALGSVRLLAGLGSRARRRRRG